VIPHFTGQLAGPAASHDWVVGSGTQFVDRAAHAIGKAIDDHAAEKEAQQAPATP
jgi:limonene 1,2-monooxygenase